MSSKVPCSWRICCGTVSGRQLGIRELDAGGSERVGEVARLLDGHDIVPVAVEDEHGHGVLIDVEDGRGLQRDGRVGLDLGDRDGLVPVVGVEQRDGQVVDAGDGDGAVHPAGDAGQLGVGVIDGVHHAEHGREVTARRVPDGADAVRVDVVLVGMGADPAHDPLGVVELRRPADLAGGLVEQPVAGEEGHVRLAQSAAGGQVPELPARRRA